MSIWLTHREYDASIFELRQAFQWAARATLSPAPGHITITREFLADVERIVGPATIRRQGVRLLRISHEGDSCMSITVSPRIPFDKGAHDALESVRSEAIRRARRLCPACGSERTAHTSDVDCCLGAAAGGVLFADDPLPTLAEDCDQGSTWGFDFSRRSEGPASASVIPNACTSPVETDETESGNAASPPCLQVFQVGDLERLKASRKGKDHETRARIDAWITDLTLHGPMRPFSLIPADFEQCVAHMQTKFGNFAEVLDFIAAHCALSSLGDGRFYLPPILLTGGPGVGKTHLARRLAALMGTTFAYIDMASAQTGALLTGTDSHWSNSREGKVFEILGRGAHANPLILLDELDKVATSDRDRADSGLFQLLEPGSAKCFIDASVRDLALNASSIVWLATANHTTAIDPPILSRFKVFHISSPTKEQCREIARSIYQDILAESAWRSAFPPTLPESVAHCLEELSPREIKNAIWSALARSARNGRRVLVPEDVLGATRPEQEKRAIGFVHDLAA